MWVGKTNRYRTSETATKQDPCDRLKTTVTQSPGNQLVCISPTVINNCFSVQVKEWQIEISQQTQTIHLEGTSADGWSMARARDRRMEPYDRSWKFQTIHKITSVPCFHLLIHLCSSLDHTPSAECVFVCLSEVLGREHALGPAQDGVLGCVIWVLL